MSEGRRILKKAGLGALYDLFNKVVPLFRSSGITKEEALEIGRKYNLEAEVREAMWNGCSPEEALAEWDLT